MLEVREVRGRRELQRFIRFPARLYAADPHWIAPLEIEVKKFLDRRKHPFYLHGDATTFVAYRDGQAAGRILASDDPRYNEFHGTNVGCFGMFECVDDPAVAAALLGAASAWLRGRGRDSILGPIDYSTNYPCGLLIDGFDSPPRVMMNHNPPYYARLLEGWGLAKAKDLYAWWFVDPHDLAARWRRRADWLARRGSIRVRPVRTDEFDAEVRRCSEVYDAAYKDNWGFVPLSLEEFRYSARRILETGDPQHVLLAEANGRPVGFSVTLPDLNEAIRPLGGRLLWHGLPIGLLRLLWRLRRVKACRMVVLVTLQEYRRRGVAELLILRTLDYGKKTRRYTGAELGWTLEDNELINRAIETVGGRRYKTYRIYEKGLA